MLSDPQSVTVATVAQSLPAISRGEDASIYRKDDGQYQLTVSHQFRAQRSRFTARLDYKDTVPDALYDGRYLPVTSSYTFTLDIPNVGISNTQAKDHALAIVAWLTSTNITKMLTGET